MPLYRDLFRGYEGVYQPIDGYLYATHRLADEWNMRNGIYKEIPGTHRHHLDFDRRNNKPTNIAREQFSRAQSARANQFWHSDRYRQMRNRILEQRRSTQAEIARRIRLRPEITQQTVRRALHVTGSIRGAAEVLNCDRSVFRRFSGALTDFRGTRQYRNHKVTAVREIAGDHDVYCLTVPETGNFALESGVFVKNCGIIVNVTPLEPEWEGHVTLEFSNTTPLPAKIYANEGVAQMLFFESDEVCETSYKDRGGKYQGQRGVTLPKT
jgi:hypothetical protein